MKKPYLRFLIAVLLASLMLACNFNSFKLNAPKIEKEIEKQIEKMDDEQGQEDENDQGKGKDDAPGQNKDKNKSKHESGADDDQNDDTNPDEMPFSLGSGEYSDEFPITDDAASLMVIGEGEGAAVNYQTQMPIDEAVKWVRETLASRGLQEDGQMTIVNDTVFSMVFTGSSTGMNLVVQGVKLDTSLTNINVRYEK